MQRRSLVRAAGVAAAALVLPTLHETPMALARPPRRRRRAAAFARATVSGTNGATSADVVCNGETASATDPNTSEVSCRR
ncbi:MAG: hypothetical protein U0031_18590 [Thermomicrobiales bacterium]